MPNNNSNDLILSLREFRDGRLSEVSKGTKLFDDLDEGAKIVIHLTSEKSLIGNEEYEFDEEDVPLPSDKPGSYGRRTNELGRVSFFSVEQKILSYLLGFYTGKIEFVDTVTLKPVKEEKKIPNKAFEKKSS